MDFQLIMLVEDMDLAREAVALLEAGGVDAYLEDRTDYTLQPLKIEWGVMADESMLKKAKSLLSQFMKDKKLEFASSQSHDEVPELPNLVYDPDTSWSSSQSSRQSMPSYQDDSNDFSLWRLLLGLFAMAVIISKIVKYCSYMP